MSTAPTTSKVQPKKKAKRVNKVREGHVYIHSSFNNTVVTVTDTIGNTLVWSSAGRAGFGGARKSTPYAAQQIMAGIVEQLVPFEMKQVKVFVKGIGNAREAAVRALGASNLAITSIKDITPIPHNGVRPKKRRRV